MRSCRRPVLKRLRLRSCGRTARTKGLPTGIYSTVFNDRANHSLDEQSFVDTQYQRAFGRDTELLGRAFFGDYHYYGNYITQDTAGTGTLIIWSTTGCAGKLTSITYCTPASEVMGWRPAT